MFCLELAKVVKLPASLFNSWEDACDCCFKLEAIVCKPVLIPSCLPLASSSLATAACKLCFWLSSNLSEFITALILVLASAISLLEALAAPIAWFSPAPAASVCFPACANCVCNCWISVVDGNWFTNWAIWSVCVDTLFIVANIVANWLGSIFWTESFNWVMYLFNSEVACGRALSWSSCPDWELNLANNPATVPVYWFIPSCKPLAPVASFPIPPAKVSVSLFSWPTPWFTWKTPLV